MSSDLQRSYKNSYMGSCHWSSGVRAWVTGAIVYLYPDSLNMNISSHFCYSLTQVLSPHIYIYIHTFCFSEMFENCSKWAPASSFTWPFIPKYLRVCFLKSKTLSYITTVQCYRIYSNFASCLFSIILSFTAKESLRSHVAFSCFVFQSSCLS